MGGEGALGVAELGPGHDPMGVAHVVDGLAAVGRGHLEGGRERGLVEDKVAVDLDAVGLEGAQQGVVLEGRRGEALLDLDVDALHGEESLAAAGEVGVDAIGVVVVEAGIPEDEEDGGLGRHFVAGPQLLGLPAGLGEGLAHGLVVVREALVGVADQD